MGEPAHGAHGPAVVSGATLAAAPAAPGPDGPSGARDTTTAPRETAEPASAPGAAAGSGAGSAAGSAEGRSGGPAEGAPEVSNTPPSSPDRPLTLANGARVVSPGRWSVQTEPGGVILSPPESGSHIIIADGGQSGAEAAVAAAWAIYRPSGAPAAVAGIQRPPREGWDETVLYRYDAPSGEPRDVLALALRKGERWTVLINDFADAISERRGAQLEVIFNSLLPQGYERETFAGRRANRLDAARIAELASLIETARQAYNIPGVALGLIQDGQIVFEGGFGVRELGRPEPVDENTLFNIASNGKALTTLMLAKLVEAERFAWETPVVDVWPAFRLGDAAVTQRVQVGQLICACTGMPRQDFEYLFEGETSTAASIMQLLSTAQPTSEFGDTYQYSNLMAAAAGFLGGHVLHPDLELGSAYDRAMQTLVFDPLGMSATTADFDIALAGNHAAGHERDVDGRMSVADQGINVMSISTRPSGNHWSSVRDILRYVRMELAGGVLPDGGRYIDGQLLKDRQTPRVTEGLNEFYGMGLKLDLQWGVPVVRHGGSTPGYRSDMIWLPEHGVGAVILINAGAGVELRSAFRRRLLELLFDGEPLAVDELTAMATRLQTATAEDRQGLTVPASPDVVAGLARQYASEHLGTVTVRQEGDATFLDFGGWSSEIATSQDETGEAALVTISPGTDGFRFTVVDGREGRRLTIREGDQAYVFAEVQ